MRKKKWMALVMMMVLVVFTACDNSEASELTVIEAQEMDVVEGSVDSQLTGAQADDILVEYTYMQPEENVILQELAIYYSNGRADGLETEIIEAKELTAETLIDALSHHNIVSIDTKVKSFEYVKEDGRIVLKLDLSKAFGEYLKTMGKNGEDVVLAALVDTFLENYQADGMWLTVEGKTLETKNGTYNEELIFMDTDFSTEDEAE